MAAAQNGLQPRVFISHTGEDGLGRLFAANILRQALEAEGLPWFIDHASLRLGCPWPSELVKAAATSEVFVVVLTQSYATRFWCLRELDIAMHGHPDHPTGAKPYIIPVYMQHHSELQQLTVEELQKQIEQRQQDLAGAQDLPLRGSELQDLQRLDPERMLRNIHDLKYTQRESRQQQGTLYATQQQQQQQQLPVVLPCSSSSSSSSRIGPLVQPPKDEEWQIARKVAAEAAQHLPAMHQPAYIPADLVGYEQQLAVLTTKLDEPGTLGLWLYGPGGVGKTTMAKMLFNKLSRDTKEFAKAAMVELDLEGSSSNQLNICLVQLLQQMQPLQQAAPVGSNPQLLQKLAELMQRHKVLLLLDNVNHDNQLDGLLPAVFSSGSRVVITSRHEKLPSSEAYLALTKEDAPALRLHNMETLDTASARQMFRHYHGLSEEQLQQLEQQQQQQQLGEDGPMLLEDQLLQACSGLPLALQVIGGALRVDGGTSAKDTLKRWQDVAHFRHGKWTPAHTGSSEAKLHGVVYFSFSMLSEAAQNIFLDSVTVLQGQPLSQAMLVWEAWWPGEAEAALAKLKQLSLISTKSGEKTPWETRSILDERLTTLDVIRVLGQSITLRPDRAGMLGTQHVGSRVWATCEGQVQGLLKGKQPVGVNLTGYTSVHSHHVLQGCDLRNLRILISAHMPPDLLHRAPQLLWIQSLDMLANWPHSCKEKCHNIPPAAPRASTAVCLQQLVVLDICTYAISRVRLGGSCVCWRELTEAISAQGALPSLRALDIEIELLEDFSEDQLAASSSQQQTSTTAGPETFWHQCLPA